MRRGEDGRISDACLREVGLQNNNQVLPVENESISNLKAFVKPAKFLARCVHLSTIS
jgi:hypothetical protein